MSRCLSVCGPPPHCGYVPSPERPICALCQESHDRYYREAEDKLVRDARQTLESRGWTLVPPTK